MKNYLERLRIAVDIRVKHSASITLQHLETTQDYSVSSGLTTCLFDTVVYDTGINSLMLHIHELTGLLKICDLRIHGVSVAMGIYNSEYITSKNESKGTVLILDEQGTWTYKFDTPVHESKNWKIGLV